MKRNSISAAIYIALVFLSGIVVGTIGLGMYNSRAEGGKSNPCTADAVRRRYIDDMKTRLDLRPDQLQRLNSILDDTHKRYRGLREKYKPEVKAIQEEQLQSIRSILDDKQRGAFEKLRQERERERQKTGQRHLPLLPAA